MILDPYLELLSTEDANIIKADVAKTIFSDANVSSYDNSDTGNIISQLTNLAKQLKR